MNVHNQRRYTSLTSLQRPDNFDNKKGSDLRKGGSDVRKPVDSFRTRKQDNGPSAKDLEILSVPDPLVTLNFRIDRSTVKDAVSNGWNGESSGSRGSGLLGGAVIGGTGTGTGTGTGIGGIDATGSQGNYQSNAYIGGLMSSVDPVTLIPKFSIDIK